MSNGLDDRKLRAWLSDERALRNDNAHDGLVCVASRLGAVTLSAGRSGLVLGL